MSIPTSDRLRPGLLGALLLALAACDPAGVTRAGPSRAQVTVAGQAVAIAAPPGYCIDRDSTRVTQSGGFLLLGDCAMLDGPGAGPATGAVLTASIANDAVLPEGDGGLDVLAEFLASERGRGLLGRSGDAARTRLVTSRVVGDVLYVLVEDRGAQPLAGVSPEFWRAFVDLRGRMTALTVQGFQGSGLTRQEGLRLVQAFAAATRAANPAGA